MPLYEYRCKPCGHRFEKIQSFSAPDEKECPVCHGEVERLISAPAVHFSGSGFYSTDYPSKSSGAPKGSESGSKEGVSGKTDGTSSAVETGAKPKPGTASESGASAPASTSAPAASTSSSDK